MLIDIFGVLANQWDSILILLAVIFSGMFIIISLLRKATDSHLTDIEYFSLGISGWLIPTLVLAFLARLFLVIFDSNITVLALAGSSFLYWLFSLRGWRLTTISPVIILLTVILLFSIAINMALISRITFPSYFDSAEHYRIIKFLLKNPALFTHKWPTPSYYHLGYHLILVAIVKLSGVSIVDGMLISGQVALSILSVSLFFIVKQETASNTAAFFTTLLAGFGWHMPAYAVNWGKYPALFGLIGIIFVFNLAYLLLHDKANWLEVRKLILLLAVGAAVSTIIHTRSLIVGLLFVAAMLAAKKYETLDKKFQQFISGIFFLIILAFGIFLRADATLTSLLSPYLENDLPAVCLVVFLGIFAFWKFPKFTFALLLFIGLMLVSLYIPLNRLLGYSGLFLLDRPYVQIILHIPFSLIGGLGFAGLFEAGQDRVLKIAPVIATVQIGMFGLLAVNVVFYQNYDASDCCQLAGRDDAAAFSWIQNELPLDSIFLIASQRLSLGPDRSVLSTTGVDAGIWVTPITERKTLLFSSDTDFSRVETRTELCNLHVDFIYVGGRQDSFIENGLKTKPEWYKSGFVLPGAKIYQQLGCSD